MKGRKEGGTEGKRERGKEARKARREGKERKKYFLLLSSPEDVYLFYKDIGGGKEWGLGERHQCERETLIGCLLHVP